MKKLASILFCFTILLSSFAVNSSIIGTGPSRDKSERNVISDPFENDPFFQSQDDLLHQMQNMQKAMEQLMEARFSKINHLANQYNQKPFGSDTNIEIRENSDQLVYKIKLPAGMDNKVDISVKNNTLVISLNATQKITHTHDNSQSVTYSQSNYSQSFKLPQGYDANSMHTDTKNSNLIITFKKMQPLHKINNIKNAL